MKLNYLLILIPVAITLHGYEASPIFVFLATALALIPLSSLMGDATEDLAHYMGPSVGGLLNATMGTIPDIIIGFFALRHGLVEVVKASITGAIVGNLLLGLGLALVVGGLRHVRGLSFDHKASHLLGGLMLLATIGLIIPAIFDFSTDSEREISFEVSIVLIVTYVLSAIFTLVTPSDDAEMPLVHSETHADADVSPKRSQGRATLLLLGVTALLAWMSELLTDSVEPTANMLGFTATFTGIFLLAPVGSAVEMINCVRFARNNKMDIALSSTVGSSSQMALLVAPILVFTGVAIGQPMNLLFCKFQVIAIILAVVAVNNILNLGMVRWISGAKLIAIYLMLAIGFYYQP